MRTKTENFLNQYSFFGFPRGSQTLSCADPDKELLEVRNRKTVMVQVSVEHILYVWVGVGAMLCGSDNCSCLRARAIWFQFGPQGVCGFC